MTMPAELRLYDPRTGISWMAGDQQALHAAGGAVVSVQGLDVANFQGNFGWAAVKAHYPALGFGIHKMTEGLTFTDGFAGHNHDGIRAAGLAHGAYHFLRPASDGTAQAQFFVGQHHKIGLTDADMLWLDHEVADGRSPGEVASCARAFMTELHRLCPRNPMGVYTMISFATGGECAGLGAWPLWLAFPSSHAPVPPPPWARWSFWQWGTRNGVDADAYNGTAAQLSSWLATFQPQPPQAGPFRHLTDGRSLAQIASARKTSVDHLFEMALKHYTKADRALLADAVTSDVAYYTSTK